MAASWRRANPTPGWKPKSGRTGFVNPRPPAVPATLHLSLDEYYAGAALMGLFAAQSEEPDPDWITDEAIDVGKRMATKIRKFRVKQ